MTSMTDGYAETGRDRIIVEIAQADRTPRLIARLVDVWEGSVRATHTFLTDGEIARIKQYVPEALATVPRLAIAVGMQDDDRTSTQNVTSQTHDGALIGECSRILGFMGAAGDMLDMLFVADGQRGRGIGRMLLEYGMDRLDVMRLTVNEQNPQARGFYEHMGFRVTRRTETDEQGGPYPLLWMER